MLWSIVYQVPGSNLSDGLKGVQRVTLTSRSWEGKLSTALQLTKVGKCFIVIEMLLQTVDKPFKLSGKRIDQANFGQNYTEKMNPLKFVSLFRCGFVVHLVVGPNEYRYREGTGSNHGEA